MLLASYKYEEFKKGELDMLVKKGFRLVFGFGNRPSDEISYSQSRIPYRFYFENTDTRLRSCSKIKDVALLPESKIVEGDWRIQSYGSVMSKTAGLPGCP